MEKRREEAKVLFGTMLEVVGDSRQLRKVADKLRIDRWVLGGWMSMMLKHIICRKMSLDQYIIGRRPGGVTFLI